MHEEAVRVPCFFHSPILPNAGTISQALVSSLDIYPTLLDYAGAPAIESLMGQSLRKIIEHPDTKLRDSIASECVGVGGQLGQGHRMVRTEHFKYIFSGDNEEALYDLRTDPFELKNLAVNSADAGPLQTHRNLLTSWMNQVGDTHARPAKE